MANGNGNGTDQTGQQQPESGFSIVNTISVMVVVGFFVVLGAVQFIIPENASAQVLSITNILIGALVASFTTVVGYHFGSSRTAKDSATANRDTIKTLANTAASTAQTAATAATTAATAATAAVGGTVPPSATVTTTTETRVDPAAQTQTSSVLHENNTETKSQP